MRIPRDKTEKFCVRVGATDNGSSRHYHVYAPLVFLGNGIGRIFGGGGASEECEGKDDLLGEHGCCLCESETREKNVRDREVRQEKFTTRRLQLNGQKWYA